MIKLSLLTLLLSFSSFSSTDFGIGIIAPGEMVKKLFSAIPLSMEQNKDNFIHYDLNDCRIYKQGQYTSEVKICAFQTLKRDSLDELVIISGEVNELTRFRMIQKGKGLSQSKKEDLFDLKFKRHPNANSLYFSLFDSDMEISWQKKENIESETLYTRHNSSFIKIVDIINNNERVRTIEAVSDSLEREIFTVRKNKIDGSLLLFTNNEITNIDPIQFNTGMNEQVMTTLSFLTEMIAGSSLLSEDSF